MRDDLRRSRLPKIVRYVSRKGSHLIAVYTSSRHSGSPEAEKERHIRHLRWTVTRRRALRVSPRAVSNLNWCASPFATKRLAV